MKINKNKLSQIIKEEYADLLKEASIKIRPVGRGAKDIGEPLRKQVQSVLPQATPQDIVDKHLRPIIEKFFEKPYPIPDQKTVDGVVNTLLKDKVDLADLKKFVLNRIELSKAPVKGYEELTSKLETLKQMFLNAIESKESLLSMPAQDADQKLFKGTLDPSKINESKLKVKLS